MKKIDLRKYIREKLEQEQMIQIMAETRRDGSRGWITREQLHADEAIREDRIRSTLPNVDELLVVALNPDTGLYGVFEVIKPEPEFDFENGGTEAADPLQSAQQASIVHAERVYRAGTSAESAIKDICNGTIKHYEDLSAETPSDVHFDTVLSMLAQARKPAMELDTLKGRIKLGGVEHMKKSLPCRTTYRVLADIREIDDDGKPNGTLSFKLQGVESTASSLPDILNTKRRIGAALQTGSDAKALALLHFAKFHQTMVKLELQMEYQIAERLWDIKVVEILEEQELLAKDRPAQAVFSDW